MESRQGAGSYIIIFVIVCVAIGFLLTSITWLRESSPSTIAARASATSVSRDSLSSFLVSAGQGYTYVLISTAIFTGVVVAVVSPIAAVAMTMMFLQARKPTNNFLIIGESRGAIREVLPDLLRAGINHEDAKALIVRGEHRRR